MDSVKVAENHSPKNGTMLKADSAGSISKILDDAVQDCILKTESMKHALEKNLSIDKTHNTPLHYAARLGDLKLARNLLKNGVFIMTVNANYNTPLHEAFISGQEEIVDLILNFMEQSLNFLNLKNSHGLTHLHIASTRKNGRIIQNFIAAGASVKDVVNKDSPHYPDYTVLRFAVEFKAIEVIEVLVRACKINGYDKNILNTIRYQHMFRSVNVAMIELHHNAAEKLKCPGSNRLTDFQMACFKEEPDFVKNLLINYGEDADASMSHKATFCPLYAPLHFAVEANKKETVKLLTQYGADVEKRNGHYMTPLHLALYYENYKEKDTIVDHLYKILVNKKANLMDLNGLSYFHIAVSRNDVTWVRYLLDQGEDVNSSILCNSRNFSFYMPLHFAVRYGHLEMAKLLIERGAKINGNEERHGDTPLHVASEVGNIDLIELLLKNGINVKAKRLIDGKTALHLLVETYLSLDEKNDIKDNLVKCIERLVDAGCDINDKDSEENTALHIACCKFPIGAKCAEALIACGANVNIEDGYNQTPLICSYYFNIQDNVKDYLKMYNHVQNLKALEMEINAKNERFCDVLLDEISEWNKDDKYCKDELSKLHDERLLEIECMKNFKLAEDLSLYDYLKSSQDIMANLFIKDILHELFLDRDLEEIYPTYSYLIKIQCKKSCMNLKAKHHVQDIVEQEL